MVLNSMHSSIWKSQQSPSIKLHVVPPELSCFDKHGLVQTVLDILALKNVILYRGSGVLLMSHGEKTCWPLLFQKLLNSGHKQAHESSSSRVWTHNRYQHA